MFYNPYNFKIYILGLEKDAVWYNSEDHQYINIPDIYTLDLQTDQFSKALTIIPDEYDHHESPSIHPYYIGFTSSGHGIVCLKTDSNSGLRWKMIDCTKNDSLYIYPYYDNIIDEYIDFNSVHMNYNYNKLYLTQPYGSCNYGIYDETTQKISILQPSSTTQGVFIRPNKKSDKFYAGQLYDQFVIDVDGDLSQISYIDNRKYGSADFSYRANEDDVIYFCDREYFQVLNYSNGQTLMWCDAYYRMRKLTTTMDGIHAIMYRRNENTTSSLYIFDTEYFYRHLE
jgi:hypothetical protein